MPFTIVPSSDMSTTLALWLVRHGESEQNARLLGGDNPDYPDHAVPLTKTGHEQAAAAGDFLTRELYSRKETPENIALFTSPYVRAAETTKEICRKLKPAHAIENDMLVEQDFGWFDGVKRSEVMSRFPKEMELFKRARAYHGKFFARRPNGESPMDVEIRQRFFLQDLQAFQKAHPELKHAVIVGHGAQLTVLRKLLMAHTYEWYETEPNPGNASVQLVLQYQHSWYKDAGYVHGDIGQNEADG